MKLTWRGLADSLCTEIPVFRYSNAHENDSTHRVGVARIPATGPRSRYAGKLSGSDYITPASRLSMRLTPAAVRAATTSHFGSVSLHGAAAGESRSCSAEFRWKPEKNRGCGEPGPHDKVPADSAKAGIGAYYWRAIPRTSCSL